MRWVRLEGPGDLSSNSIETVPIGPTLTSEIRGVSALEGGLGLAVGYVLPSIPAAPGVFVSQPHVWMIPASAIDPASPMLLPSPTLAGVAVLGGRADDIEQAKWRGARSTQRVAVGYSVERDPSTGLLVHSGTIWFWNGTGEGQGSWTAIDVNAAGFLEPGWKIDGVSDRILSLRGVNQYGDCVGTAIVGGAGVPGAVRNRPRVEGIRRLRSTFRWTWGPRGLPCMGGIRARATPRGDRRRDVDDRGGGGVMPWVHPRSALVMSRWTVTR